MGSYVFRRSLYSAASLVGLVVLVFFLARLTGNPADLYLPVDATEELRQQFIRIHGLDDPLWVQFGRFVLGAVQFDFGESIRLGQPALGLVMDALPTTLTLGGFAIGLALLVGIPTGALAAWRPNSIFDRLATIISLAGASVPGFWLAIVAVMIFAVQLRLFPTSGTGGPIYWVLPVGVLMIRPCGLIAQVVRGSMVNALSAGYVKTARAKGVNKRTIIFVHALRNAMLPVITVAGDEAAGIINGAVIAETIFGLPGVGRLLIESIYARDFAVIQATVLITALAIFILNFVIDLIYGVLDPRIRHN